MVALQERTWEIIGWLPGVDFSVASVPNDFVNVLIIVRSIREVVDNSVDIELVSVHRLAWDCGIILTGTF